MKQVDYYTGEQMGIPFEYQDQQMSYSDPNTRMQNYNQSQSMMNPGGYGYNTQYNMMGDGFQNPSPYTVYAPQTQGLQVQSGYQGGLGQPPMMQMQQEPIYYQQPQQQYQPYQIYPNNPGYQQQTAYGYGYVGTGYQQQPQQQCQPYQIYPNGYQQQASYGYVGNPAFQMMNQMNPQPMFYQAQDRVIHVPGFRPGGEYLLPADYEEQCNRLKMELLEDLEKAEVKREQRFQGFFNNNYGNNYYGLPYQSYMVDQEVLNKYRIKIEEIQNQARQKRMELNKRLSRIAHGYFGEELTDEQLDIMYGGYTYTIPAANIQQDYEQQRLMNLIPIDNQQMYVNNHNMVHAFYQGLIGEGDMNDFLEKQGIIKVFEQFDENYHQKRNAARYYEGDPYRRHLRKAIMEREGVEQQQSNMNGQPVQQSGFASQFPTLSQCSTILEDGTLSIKAPDWIGTSSSRMNRQAVIDNENERHFEENRRRFLDSIYAQNGA